MGWWVGLSGVNRGRGGGVGGVVATMSWCGLYPVIDFELKWLAGRAEQHRARVLAAACLRARVCRRIQLPPWRPQHMNMIISYMLAMRLMNQRIGLALASVLACTRLCMPLPAVTMFKGTCISITMSLLVGEVTGSDCVRHLVG